MGAERRDPAQSCLCVCTAELLLLAHLLHHLDHPPSQPPPPHYHAPHYPPSLLLSFYLPVVPFNKPKSLLVHRTKMEGIEGGMDGGREVGGVNKGFVSGACRQHTCCLKRADIRAQQETVDGEGMEGWMSFSSSHHFLSLRFPTDELDN